MKTSMSLNVSIDIPDCKIDTIIAAFKKVLPLFLAGFVRLILEGYVKEVMSFLVCARNGVQSKAESYLANFVKENTSTDSIDLYQIRRAAGQVETILELTSHTSYAPVKRQGELFL